MKQLLFIVGTRPEAIKIAPLYFELKRNARFSISIGITGQHKELVYHALEFFQITADFDLGVMTDNQPLNVLFSKILSGLDPVLVQAKPDYIIVQGDTSTVFASALAAFHHGIKVIHLEAGLRSGDMSSPFPEEANRRLTSTLTDIHFAPTPAAKTNLVNEGISERVFVVGNTVVDALFLALQQLKQVELKHQVENHFSFLDAGKKIILVTSHRRENFGNGVINICRALAHIAAAHRDVQICFPVHPNPNIQDVVRSELGNVANIHLIEPLSYPYLAWIMSQSHFIMSDSGGIQEEAPSLGKPVLVMRDKTERMEGVEAGNAILVGTDYDRIVDCCTRLLNDHNFYSSFSIQRNPYGDGTTSQQIGSILAELI